jgi:hypothetical protein
MSCPRQHFAGYNGVIFVLGSPKIFDRSGTDKIKLASFD